MRRRILILGGLEIASFLDGLCPFASWTLFSLIVLAIVGLAGTVLSTANSRTEPWRSRFDDTGQQMLSLVPRRPQVETGFTAVRMVGGGWRR